jgi:hypothetical protein
MKNSDKNESPERFVEKTFEAFKEASGHGIDEIYIKNEVRAFIDGDLQSSRELAKLYEYCNAPRTGRQGRFRKKSFALYWLFIKFRKEESISEYLREQLGLPRLRLIRGKKTKEIKNFEKFIEDLFMDPKDLCFIDQKKLIRYERKRELEKALVDKVLNPELIRIKEKDNQAKAIEQGLYQIKRGQSPQALACVFEESLAMDPEDRALIKRNLKRVRQESKFVIKLFEFLRQKKLVGEDQVSQRDIQRRFTKTAAALQPILEELKFNRVILWDKEKKVVGLQDYNPRDRRKFIWLAASSWPRSPFEPFLETGKTYKMRDFRERVVEEWVKTGAARFI